jgi:soluble lytic murein transglycosylase-like protein
VASRRLLGIAVAGTVLLAGVPVAEAGTRSGARTYTVRRGDSLWAIAQRQGVPLDALARANGLTYRSVILPGQVLTLPLAGGGPPATPPTATTRPVGATAATTAGTRSATTGAPTPPLPAGVPPRLPAEVRGAAQVALVPLFDEAAAQAGVPVDLLMSVAYQESRWRQDRVSPDGAIGVLQLLPGTASWIATNLVGDPSLDPRRTRDNVRMGARFLRYLVDLMGGDLVRALAAYNEGPNRVLLVGMSSGGRRYAEQILGRRSLFQR